MLPVSIHFYLTIISILYIFRVVVLRMRIKVIGNKQKICVNLRLSAAKIINLTQEESHD